MKKTENSEKRNSIKRKYRKPAIERIRMDYEISVLMQTTPPGDPEPYFNPDHPSGNPFKFFKY